MPGAVANTIPRVTLCYHAVTGRQGERFRRQVEIVARGTVRVTFDDGYACLLEASVRVMAERGIGGTVFAVAGNLGREPGWRMAAGRPEAGRRLMSAKELKALPADLFRIGSHTWSHPRLDRLPAAQARRELGDSKRFLEDLTGRPVVSLAFPHGAYTPETVDLAYACGYEELFTIEPCRHPGPLPMGLIGRVEVSADDPMWLFRLKASGGYDWMHHLRRAKRAVLGRQRRQRGCVAICPTAPTLLHQGRAG